MTETQIFLRDTPAEGGANNIGSSAAGDLPDACSQFVGAAVIEPPKPESPAEVRSDVIENEAQEISDTAFRIASLENECVRLTSDINAMASAARKFCSAVADLVDSGKYPINLFECRIALEQKLSQQAARISALELALIEADKIKPFTRHKNPEDGNLFVVSSDYILINNIADARRHALEKASDRNHGRMTLIAPIESAERVQVQTIWEKL